MQRTCKQCGATFELTDSEIEFYESKGLDLPKRCADCRKKNREAKRGGTTESGANSGGAKTQGASAQAGGRRASGTAASGSSRPSGRGSSSHSKPASASSKIIGGIAAVAVAVAVGVFGIGGTGAQQSQSTPAPTPAQTTAVSDSQSASQGVEHKFRKNSQLNEHYEKHGVEMGFASAADYQAAANAVIANPDALHKLEAEDGDDVYYLEATDEIVFVSRDGYIRTYFKPGGKDYFERQ